jgi:hypothetical protein
MITLLIYSTISLARHISLCSPLQKRNKSLFFISLSANWKERTPGNTNVVAHPSCRPGYLTFYNIVRLPQFRARNAELHTPRYEKSDQVSLLSCKGGFQQIRCWTLAGRPEMSIVKGSWRIPRLMARRAGHAAFRYFAVRQSKPHGCFTLSSEVCMAKVKSVVAIFAGRTEERRCNYHISARAQAVM